MTQTAEWVRVAMTTGLDSYRDHFLHFDTGKGKKGRDRPIHYGVFYSLVEYHGNLPALFWLNRVILFNTASGANGGTERKEGASRDSSALLWQTPAPFSLPSAVGEAA